MNDKYSDSLVAQTGADGITNGTDLIKAINTAVYGRQMRTNIAHSVQAFIKGIDEIHGVQGTLTDEQAQALNTLLNQMEFKSEASGKRAARLLMESFGRTFKEISPVVVDFVDVSFNSALNKYYLDKSISTQVAKGEQLSFSVFAKDGYYLSNVTATNNMEAATVIPFVGADGYNYFIVDIPMVNGPVVVNIQDAKKPVEDEKSENTDTSGDTGGSGGVGGIETTAVPVTYSVIAYESDGTVSSDTPGNFYNKQESIAGEGALTITYVANDYNVWDVLNVKVTYTAAGGQVEDLSVDNPTEPVIYQYNTAAKNGYTILVTTKKKATQTPEVTPPAAESWYGEQILDTADTAGTSFQNAVIDASVNSVDISKIVSICIAVAPGQTLAGTAGNRKSMVICEKVSGVWVCTRSENAIHQYQAEHRTLDSNVDVVTIDNSIKAITINCANIVSYYRVNDDGQFSGLRFILPNVGSGSPYTKSSWYVVLSENPFNSGIVKNTKGIDYTSAQELHNILMTGEA